MLPFEAMAVLSWLPVFALVVGRIGGLLMFQPVIGGLAIPMQVKALLIVGLSAVVTPFVQFPSGAPLDLLTIIVALGHEMLLGVLIGLVLRSVFLGVQYAGELIAQESGVSFGEVVDPGSDVGQSVIGGFYQQIATVLFLIIGGHRILIAATLDSFDTIPLLSVEGRLSAGFDMFLDALQVGVTLGIRIGAPVLVTLFLANVALGFLGRTVPQLNILTLGFSIKGMAALLLMTAGLPMGMEVFLAGLTQVTDWVDEFLSRG